MKCPRCNGTGNLFPSIPDDSPYSNYDCHQCGGRGEVDEDMLEWMESGKKLKDRAFRELKMYYTELENATKIKGAMLANILDGVIEYPKRHDPMKSLEKWIEDETEKGRWPPRGWENRV